MMGISRPILRAIEDLARTHHEAFDAIAIALLDLGTARNRVGPLRR